MLMVPTLVASHIVVPNWRAGVSLSNPAGFDRSGSFAGLRENEFEVHPDTPHDDPVLRMLGAASRPLTPR